MPLKEEMQEIDSEQFVRVADAVQDKMRLPKADIYSMINSTFCEYPAFTDLISYLLEKFGSIETISHEEMRGAVIGAASVLLTLREYVEFRDMQDQFPDTLE